MGASAGTSIIVTTSTTTTGKPAKQFTGGVVSATATRTIAALLLIVIACGCCCCSATAVLVGGEDAVDLMEAAAASFRPSAAAIIVHQGGMAAASTSAVVPKFGDRISPRHRPQIDGGGVASNSGGGVAAVAAAATPPAPIGILTISGRNTSSRNAIDAYIGIGDAGVGNDAVERLWLLQRQHHDHRTGRSSNHLHGISNEVTEVSAVTVTGGNNNDADESVRQQNDENDDDDEDDDDDNEDDRNHNGHFIAGIAIPLAPSAPSAIGDTAEIRNQYAVDERRVQRQPGPASEQNSSSAQAHRLEMSTEFFVVPSSTAAASIGRSTTIRPGGVVMVARPQLPPHNISAAGNTHGNRLVTAAVGGSSGSSPVTPPTIVSTAPYYASGLRREPWVVPVLVLAALTMIMMAAFEIFVLCKAWRTSPSRRHLFLGQMLLLGLFACAGIAAIITATPTLLSCATVRFGAGVAYALVFASLLVKCVFLISLNGGVYLPAPYQGLLLLFAVLIQVAIGAQWLLTSPPAMDNVQVQARSAMMAGGGATSSAHASASASMPASGAAGRYPLLLTAQDVQMMVITVPLCRTPFTEVVFSLVYVLFLIVFVAVLAIKSRGIRDNYREATYIGLAIGGSIPIWFAWILCGLAVSERHKDACLAFGLVATSATVFLVMFMPKGRQLAAMGKEGLYVEDREEQFSSLSRAGSGYSPSFFHFKPIKYGVMGGGGGGAAPVVTTTSTTHTTAGGPGNQHSGSNNNNNNNNNSSNNMNSGGGGGHHHSHHHGGAGAVTSGKHQQAAAAIATLGGDRVALVAAPPSYTRMYHYYPAQLTHPYCYYSPPPLPPPPPPPQHAIGPGASPLPPSALAAGIGGGLGVGHARYPGAAAAFIRIYDDKTLGAGGLFMRPDEANLYTTLEPTLSSNPNVYFQRGGGVHPGMMY